MISKFRADLFKAVSLIIISSVIAIGCGEIILRVIFGDKFAPRPGFYIADDRLGWKPAANLHNNFYGADFKMSIITDAEGHRLGSQGPVDFSKEIIVLLGDSYTFGWGVNSNETVASYLDEMVSRVTDNRMRVVNLGVGGYGTWQYLFRLKELFDKHPDIKLKAVIINHCNNDARDNVKSIGYHVGRWKNRTVVQKRSQSHLVNFLDYAGKIAKLRWHGQKLSTTTDVIDDGLTDILWSFELGERKFPQVVIVNKRRTDLSSTSQDDLKVHDYFTPIQKNLFVEGVTLMHQLLSNRGAAVFHCFVYDTNPAYIKEASAVIKSVPAGGSRITIFDNIPERNSYNKEVLNRHSGAHFTADFNKFWAERLLSTLNQYKIL